MKIRPPVLLACVTAALGLAGHDGASPCALEMGGNTVRVFARAIDADSTSTPVRSLDGVQTGLCDPRDLAIDAHGRLHVLGRDVVTVYEPGSAGDLPPARWIEVAEPGVNALGLGLDHQGNIYVSTDELGPTDSGSITVYGRGAAGERPPLRSLRGPRTGLLRPAGVAVDADGRIYVTNAKGNTVRRFAPGASGNVAPIGILEGPATGLSGAYGLALDSRGRLYVANNSGNKVTVYASGAMGDVAPVRTITTPDTCKPSRLSSPTWLTLDAHDTLYVVARGAVFVYAPEASGDVAPVRWIRADQATGVAVGQDGSLHVADLHGRISVFAPGAVDSGEALRTIEGPLGRRDIQGLALGPRGDTLYATGIEESTVTVYPPGAAGIPLPARKLYGPSTEISAPQGIAVDRRGTLYVANGPLPRPQGAIRVYRQDASGHASPVRVLVGRATGLAQPSDVAFDSRGHMYVVNNAGLVTVYREDADGNAAPIRTISGPSTLLRRPARLALGPADTLVVLNTFNSSRGSPPSGTGYTTVTVYAPYATGDIEPVRSIVVNGGPRSAGSKLLLNAPTGVAVDARGSVYVANLASGAVAVYAPGAAGDVMPVRLLRGPTTVGSPVGVAVSPFGELYVASLAQPVWDGWHERSGWLPRRR